MFTIHSLFFKKVHKNNALSVGQNEKSNIAENQNKYILILSYMITFWIIM